MKGARVAVMGNRPHRLIIISSIRSETFMPRDNDKNNDSPRGRRDGPAGGKGRSGAARGPDKKFAKRGFAGKSDGERRPYTPRPDGEKRPYAGKSDGGGPSEKKFYGKKPYSGPGKP